MGMIGRILGLLAGLVLLAAPAADAQLTRVKYNEVVHAIFYAPKYVALNEGMFRAEGLDIQLSTAWGGDKSMAALVSGAAEIALLGPEPSIYLVRQGAERRAINFAQLTQRDGLFLMARKPMPNFKWTDVKGKTIIGQRVGGTPFLFFNWALHKHGVDPKRDTKVIPYTDLRAIPGVFKAGQGDFVHHFDPAIAVLEREGAGYVVASVGLATGFVPYTTFNAMASYIERNPTIVQKFTNAIYRAQLWAQRNSAEEIARAIAPSFPDTDRDLVLRAVKRFKEIDAWQKDPILRPEGLDLFQEVMIYNKELDKKVPYAEIVTTRFAQRAVETIRP
ncbi:MAG: ABC transporter substrate-binding protein [Deltaproteobacteria bacterium]|nr:ABC transporter substrate-binding protein [Deltaproteobacteria bacterium]MBI3076586.1 ABC transporter substrate-binding protein [Deltaproteobacteria bacterium]